MTNRRTYRTDSYFNEMYDDVLEYIAENIDIADYTEDGELNREELEEKLNDDCFIEAYNEAGTGVELSELLEAVKGA